MTGDHQDVHVLTHSFPARRSSELGSRSISPTSASASTCRAARIAKPGGATPMRAGCAAPDGAVAPERLAAGTGAVHSGAMPPAPLLSFAGQSFEIGRAHV